MAEINLLVTFDPVHQESAKKEIETLLKELNESGKIVKISNGLAQLTVKDPRKLIDKLLGIIKKEVEKFNYTFNWWPVDVWCKAEIKEMQKAIAEIQKGIKNEEKWKMELAKRETMKEYPKDLIIKLTDVVNKPKVDLSNPDKIIKVEIIGDKAAITLTEKNKVFNTSNFK
ncbi:MAG: THUMP domain-containing protein [Candidatus Pacearchaeota archaeon]|nr:THUMP domain-containing protein [Candidatus Pacearchaeota archaeon]